MSSLWSLRSQISSLDAELLRILDERMKLAEWVAEYKKVNNLPIFDPVREKEILEEIPELYRSLWQEMMNISKKIQADYLEKTHS